MLHFFLNVRLPIKFTKINEEMESITHTQEIGGKFNILTIETQMLDLLNFKSAIINVFKELKENTQNEFRERMRIMCHQIKRSVKR